MQQSDLEHVKTFTYLGSITDKHGGSDTDKQGREGVGPKGWRIQSQIRVYLWLGLIKDFTAYTFGLPGGYDKNIFKTPKPPNELIYLGKK
ncbi:unnamed protein product [Schistosoma curassoni]|uniref:Transposase n=1 Tax=Schistosoma curassoni TaxID=6186 RepID=A0A183KZ30_9TREM|nr:unnamed protein product [Schistosoma curassoni]